MKPTRLGLITPVLLGLSACSAIGPDYREPESGISGGQEIAVDPALTSNDDEPSRQWWQELGDASLDALVATAFAENRELRAAVANVSAARALLRLERTNLRPQGSVSAAAERRQIAGAAFGQEDVTFPDIDFYEVGLATSWELDLFGRVRRLTEAALAEAQLSEAIRRDTQALVAAETVRAWADYRGAEIRLAVARRNLEVQRESLRLTRTRLEEGLGSQLDVARAEAQSKTTEASIAPLQSERIAAANRLATLTGTPVAAIHERLQRRSEQLPPPPRELSIGDPGSLILRRADVRGAERALAAATARIGVSRADYLPRISLDGSASLAALSTSALGDSGAFGYNVGPRLTWIGFDVPRVRAQVSAAGARAEAAFAAYEQALLRAFEEAQTAIASYGRETVRFDALVIAAARASEAADLARDRYDAGVDDFLDVLDAESRQLEAEAALAISRAALNRLFADVYRSLGAGWEVRPDDLMTAR